MFDSFKGESGKQTRHYDPVSRLSEEDGDIPTWKQPSQRRWSISTIFIAASFLLNAVTILLLFMQFRTYQKFNPQLLYSPAQAAIEYKVVKFNDGFPANNDTTKYQGKPSPELDAHWENLYKFGLSRIPKSQARQLTNKTAPIPGDDGQYIVSLDVFHQLHCLNMIRKALAPDYYPKMMVAADGEDELLGFTHLDHCVDSIRQSIMCHSDVSTYVFQWKDDVVKERAAIPHTCRNFDKIRDWAIEHQLRKEFDPSVLIEDDIVIPEF